MNDPSLARNTKTEFSTLFGILIAFIGFSFGWIATLIGFRVFKIFQSALIGDSMFPIPLWGYTERIFIPFWAAISAYIALKFANECLLKNQCSSTVVWWVFFVLSCVWAIASSLVCIKLGIGFNLSCSKFLLSPSIVFALLIFLRCKPNLMQI